MIKCFNFTFLFILLFSCSLNSSQEKKLNKALSTYLTSKNAGNVLGTISLTYPPLVKEWKLKGDNYFKEKVKLSNDTTDLKFFENTFLKTIKKQNNSIQIKYELDIYSNSYKTDPPSKTNLFAISEDNGKSWFFMENEVYINLQACKKLKRLIQ